MMVILSYYVMPAARIGGGVSIPLPLYTPSHKRHKEGGICAPLSWISPPEDESGLSDYLILHAIRFQVIKSTFYQSNLEYNLPMSYNILLI